MFEHFTLHLSHPILIHFPETVVANEVEEIHEKLLNKCTSNNYQTMNAPQTILPSNFTDSTTSAFAIDHSWSP